MFQLFTHKKNMNQLPEQLRGDTVQDSTETSIYEHFLYSKSEVADAQLMDACEFLSSSTFDGNPNVAVCRQNDDMDGHCGNMDNTEYKMMMSTLSYENSIQRNTVDAFRVSTLSSLGVVEKAARTEEVLTKYHEVASCSEQYFSKVDIDLSSGMIDTIIKKLDLNLRTGEGDLLPQHMDCVFLGAYNKTFFAPTNSDAFLESMMYSRHKKGESRDFELPCVASVVYDTHAKKGFGLCIFTKNMWQ